MKRDATLSIAVIYDDEKADAEQVAEAIQKALDSTLSEAGMLDACGGIEVGEVLIAIDGLGIV